MEVDAANWGYVRRRRLYWLHGPSGGVDDGEMDLELPEGIVQENGTDRLKILKVDSKPWPAQARFEAGFSMKSSPENVCKGIEDPIHVFTREFRHPADRAHLVDLQSRLRFEMDGRRFPPSAYTETSVLWRNNEWRQPSPNERAQLMGIPTTALQEIMVNCVDKKARIAKLNCAIVNGFHLPSVMLMLVLLFQLSDKSMAISPPRSWSLPEELELVRKVRNTVYDDRYLKASPHVSTSTEVAVEVLRLLGGIEFPEIVRQNFMQEMALVDVSPL